MHTARGPAPIGPRDLTGRRVAELAGRAQAHTVAKANMVNSLNSDPVTVVQVSGGRSYLCPVELRDFLWAEGRASD